MTMCRALAVLALPVALALPLTLGPAAGRAGAQAQKAAPPGTSRPSPGEAPRGTDRLEKAAAEVVRATQDYRASLDKLLGVYEREAVNAAALVELRRDLHRRGIIARRELDEAERALATAQDNVEETRQWMAEADYIIAEATVAELLARLSPLPRGGYHDSGALIRYNGPARWSLREAPRVREFFLGRFGRALPVSALGQTAAHDRIGFDHSNALDVAVHPDSPEGRVLMDYLRAAGIPFIAFKGAVAGAATGAHVHIGQPSPRLAARR